MKFLACRRRRARTLRFPDGILEGMAQGLIPLPVIVIVTGDQASNGAFIIPSRPARSSPVPQALGHGNGEGIHQGFLAVEPEAGLCRIVGSVHMPAVMHRWLKPLDVNVPGVVRPVGLRVQGNPQERFQAFRFLEDHELHGRGITAEQAEADTP